MDYRQRADSVEYQDDDELVVVCGRGVAFSDKYFPLVSKSRTTARKSPPI